jgi:hypothetical protein
MTMRVWRADKSHVLLLGERRMMSWRMQVVYEAADPNSYPNYGPPLVT